MRGISLGKTAKDALYQQKNGTGIVYIKAAESVIISFEFHRGKNGQLYMNDAEKPLKVTTELEWLSNLIPEDEG